MRIGVVGGLDRNATALRTLALSHGHELELHTGVIASSGASSGLKNLVQRAELVLVLTDVNSHNAVRTARLEAQRWHRPLRIMRRLGPSQLKALLQSLPPATTRAA
jgi:hypothetical protein